MRVLRRLALVASFVVGAASGATAQSVRFRVTDDIDEAPVPTALVTLLTDRAMWRADESGILMVRVRHAGPNVFTIRRIGYEPVTTTLDVPEHDMLKVHVVMHHAAQHLDTVSVSAPAMQEQISAFDRRRMNSIGGRFITLADIERKRPIETLDLFTNQLGLRVVQPPNGDAMILSSRTQGLSGAACKMRIGVDGAVFGTEFDVNDIGPKEIYGIEIYAGAATIPAEYLSAAAGSNCGLIMIWTFGGAQQSAKR
jgi:hypothetical protein